MKVFKGGMFYTVRLGRAEVGVMQVVERDGKELVVRFRAPGLSRELMRVTIKSVGVRGIIGGTEYVAIVNGKGQTLRVEGQ